MDAQACRTSCPSVPRPMTLTSSLEHRSRMLLRLLGILVQNSPSSHKLSTSSISYAPNRKDGRYVSRWLSETRSLQRWSAMSHSILLTML